MGGADSLTIHDDQIRDVFFCLWASERGGKGAFWSGADLCVDLKSMRKNILVNGKKLCREQCETDSILQLDHTMIQCFSSFIPYSFVSFEMIVCHFLGVLASFLARLYDCV